MDFTLRPSLKTHRLIGALAVSLLLHLLFLMFYAGWGRNLVFRLPALDSNPDRGPIAFEIVESRPDSEREPEKADFLSDRNQTASDKQPRNLDRKNLPFSEGRSLAKNLNTPVTVQTGTEPFRSESSSKTAQSAPEPAEKSASSLERSPRSAFSRDQLLSRNNASSATASRPAYEQTRSSAEDLGGLSLNTYAWEYAPYLLDLKQRIEKNIFPPPIYTRMGIGGSHAIRFRIMPDGRLVGPNLLEARGEKSLIATSENAVKFSAPFKPLPDDFPEPYLEVTARFDYQILNRP